MMREVLERPCCTDARRDPRKGDWELDLSAGWYLAFVLVDGRVFTIASTRIK
jgi:hypothetical protein